MMNILIIEDEVQTAWDLRESITALQPSFRISAIIDSVEAGLEWFGQHPCPQLIFSDIQLGDGLAFDIFRKVAIDCPVIFCTAYDQYAIQAFSNNGIDYLLKPLEEAQLKKCLEKVLHFLKGPVPASPLPDLAALMNLLGSQQRYKSTFLVAYRDRLIPVPTDQISFFRIAGNAVTLQTHDQQTYRLTDSLDQVESMVDPALFYRANRQYLIAFSSIKEVEWHFERRLLVRLRFPLQDPILISKAKATQFLSWMENR